MKMLIHEQYIDGAVHKIHLSEPYIMTARYMHLNFVTMFFSEMLLSIFTDCIKAMITAKPFMKRVLLIFPQPFQGHTEI